MDGLPSSLVMRYQMEVCPLARGILLLLRNPYPPHYKAAFAFSILLYPQPYRFALRLTFPRELLREDYGLTTFRVSTDEWGRSRLFAGGSASATGDFVAPVLDHLPFWLKPLSTFGLFVVTTFISDSLLLTMPFDPSSRPLWCWQPQPFLASWLPSLLMRLHCPRGFAPRRCQRRTLW